MADYDNTDYIAKLAVIGVGGQGSNLINRLYTSGLKSARTIAMNTDAKHLNMIGADKKLLLGKSSTKGMGAGGYPEVAAKAASADIEEIRKAVSGYDMVFIGAGMGGGTGTGAAPVIAQAAKDEGALVAAFVTYPFALERSRKQKADWGIQALSKAADTTIIIENDRLLSYYPNLQMEKAFELVDSIAANAIRGIADTIMFPSLINLDFADVRSVMRDAGTAVISIGMGSGQDRVQSAISSTLEHPLLSVDVEGAKSAMIHVSGGASLTIEEATKIGEGVTSGLDEKANVIFGARLNPEDAHSIMVMSIITGVKAKLGGEYMNNRAQTGVRSEVASDLELLL
jgi:cell division protein FtsZ